VAGLITSRIPNGKGGCNQAKGYFINPGGGNIRKLWHFIIIGNNLVPSLELRLLLSPATVIHADGFTVRMSKARLDLLEQGGSERHQMAK
jgi:hypothetical protein